jgi:flagellar protein FlgJ
MKKKTKNILIFSSISLILIFWFLKNKMKEKETKEQSNMFTDKKDYLITLLPFAKQIQNKYGIPYLFLLAQTAIETGYGKHTPGNNFGGIKAKPGQDFNLLWTTEHVSDVSKYPNRDKSKDKPLPNGKTSIRVQQKFAKYPDIETGLKEYIKILLLDRYKAAFNYTDPKLFAAEIKKGGYATDVNYTAKLSKMIDEIKLTLNT